MKQWSKKSMNIAKHFDNEGFLVLDDIFSDAQLNVIENEITNLSQNDTSFLRSKDLFAIRRFIKVAPDLKNLLFTHKLKELVRILGGENCFLTKAIFFDKPKDSNWFVPYHQDLSISVKEQFEVNGYKNWTKKRGQLGVIPPQEILENIITLRIHLDDTDKDNGALKVVPKSHKKGILRKENIAIKEETICDVRRGGVMAMKPLTFHASGRSRGVTSRRVIHLEFSNHELDNPLEWLEKETVFDQT